MGDGVDNMNQGREVSRRDAVKLGVAGLAGAAGVALLAPKTAEAANGPMLTGTTNAATSSTDLTNSGTGYALRVTATSGDGLAVFSGGGSGNHGVAGYSANGDGVMGQSGATGTAVFSPEFGVHGVSDVTGQSGAYGEHVADGNGVLGTTGAGGRAGVVGRHAGSGSGVLGQSEGGAGVQGNDLSTEVTAYGVFGQSPNGTGVQGVTTSGAALAGRVSGAGGVGLFLQGRALYSGCGIATIKGTVASPKSSIKVSEVDLSAQSMVLAMIQTNNVPGTFVQSAVPNVAGFSITLTLNHQVAKSVKVAWFVIDLIPPPL